MKGLVIILIYAVSALVCSGQSVEYKCVDLGLSFKWADKNVGAKTITDAGFHYAWAETAPKSEYYWTTYKYTEKGATSMTKYNSSMLGSVRDYLTILEPIDDAATVNMGQEWRTPTLEEMNELIRNCTWIWSNNYNGTGRAGYIVKSKVKGYEGNSIFLPAAGHCGGKSLYDMNKGGMYWSASLDKSSFANLQACQLYFCEGEISTLSFDRQIGMTVRAVYKDNQNNGLEEVSDPSANTQKNGVYMIKGRVLIFRNGKLYDLTGREVDMR